MRTVALETSGITGSIALLNDEHLIASEVLPSDQRSAQSLAGCLRACLRRHDWEPSQIDLIAIATGPGSFTGLRVGVTTAKMLAYAVNAAVVGVNTLEVIAAAAGSCDAIWAVIDAQRQRVFCARIARCEGQLTTTQPTTVWTVDDWLGRLEPGDAVSGPILEKLADRVPEHTTVVDRALWYPTADWVGRRAIAGYQAGRRDDIWQLVPQYFQKSAAEEQRDAAADRRHGPAN
jgi:tRNA threonylcarbamoyladenosine biosynthesis protein TsaB